MSLVKPICCCLLKGNVAEQEKRKIVDMNDNSHRSPGCSTPSIHLKTYNIYVYIEIYVYEIAVWKKEMKKKLFSSISLLICRLLLNCLGSSSGRKR